MIKRHATGERPFRKAPSSAQIALAVAAVALAAMAGVIWMQLHLPVQVRTALARPASDFGAELGEDEVAALFSYVHRCSLLGLYDLPLIRVRTVTDGLSGRGSSQPGNATEVGLAREAHQTVLEENGGEWVSKLHRLRIDRIVSMLSRVAGDDASGYKVAMLDTRQINAFSTADGRIYLTRGLVTTSTDDEIALVLAHEMHHIRAGHWINWWALGVGDGSAFDTEAEELQEDGVMSRAADALVEMGIDALRGDASTSYGQEYEADASALLHAAECGYRASGIFRLLTRLPEMPVTSHPSSSDRIAEASQMLQAIEDPAWIAAHSPALVARNVVENAVAVACGDRPGIYVQVPGLDEIAAACGETLNKIRDVEEEMRAYKWLGVGWPCEEDCRIVVRTVLFSPVLCAVDVGVETTFGHSSAGTPGAIEGRLWLVRRGGVWVVAFGQVLPGMRPVASEWAKVGDELGNAWRRVGRVTWLCPGNTVPEVRNTSGAGDDAALARGALEAAARWRDTSITDFEKHLATYARGKIEHVRNAGGKREQGEDGNGLWNAANSDGSLEAIGWAQFLSGRDARSWAWSVRCDVHSPTLATVAFSSALSLDKVPVASNFTRLTMVLEDGEWRVASVSLH